MKDACSLLILPQSIYLSTSPINKKKKKNLLQVKLWKCVMPFLNVLWNYGSVKHQIIKYVA